MTFSSEYLLQEKQFSKEINADIYHLIHNKSKAQILYLNTNDQNKTCTLVFRTPSINNTGVPHILEHSVLNGSKKYPMKDPFVHLVRTSYQNFLNAMTFADQTMYLFATTNDKDFNNLLDVYTDAVFFPLLNKETFWQEGWHYHLENLTDKMKVTGIVYSEMQGAYSNPERLLSRNILKSLFKDMLYANCSGGMPDFITDLSYEEFCDFHKTYYHPSNAKIILTGNIDIIEILEHLDKQYLNKFSENKTNTIIKNQLKYEHINKIECFYPLNKTDNLNNKIYVTKNWVLDNIQKVEDYLEQTIIFKLLIGSDASPLHMELLNSQLGQEIIADYDNMLKQPLISIGLKGVNEENSIKICNLIDNTLQTIIEHGFNEELVESTISALEFSLKEANSGVYPKGLIYTINICSYWNYDEDPFEALKWEDALTNIKNKIKNNAQSYFKDLLLVMFINNTHGSEVIFKPQIGLREILDEQNLQKIEQKQSDLSLKQKQEIINNNIQLEKYQTSILNKDEFNSLPKLSLKDINSAVNVLDINKIQEYQKYYFLHAFYDTNTVDYLSIIFPIKVNVDKTELSWISLLTNLLSRIDTLNLTYDKFSILSGIHTGGINVALKANRKYKKDDYFFGVTVQVKYLQPKYKECLNLINELFHSKFSANYNRLIELIKMEYSAMEQMFMADTNGLLSIETLALLGEPDTLNTYISGYQYYLFIKGLMIDLENNIKNIALKLEEINYNIFNTSNKSYITYTGNNSFLENLHFELNKILPNKDLFQDIINIPTKNNITDIKSVAIPLPIMVQFIKKTINLNSDFLIKNNIKEGALKLITFYLSTKFLYENIRVKNGAYGAYATYEPISLNLSLYSYRDPTLHETLQIFNDVSDHVKKIILSAEELEGLKISRLAQNDAPVSLDIKAQRAFNLYLMGFTKNDLQRNRDEIFNITLQDLQNTYVAFEELTHNGILGVGGNRDLLLNNKEIFDTFINE